MEFGNVDFAGGRKSVGPREKLSERGKNQQQTQPTYDLAEIECEPHWWEAGALTTAPSLLPDLRRPDNR